MVTELQQSKGSYFLLITEIKIKIIIAFGETSWLTMFLFCHLRWGKEITRVEKKMIDIKKMSYIIGMILVARTLCSAERPGKSFSPGREPEADEVPGNLITL